jgi:D-tyrosyl-tRNA(Tyr) deacylase
MRIVAQRVGEASVAVAGRTVAAIERGLLVLAGVGQGDTDEDAAWLAGKLARMRVFPDAEGKMNLSVADIAGQVLVVSQFTLYASTAKGNRPSFTGAAAPADAERLYLKLVSELARELGKPVPMGVFGADMQVALRNEGPVTLLMDSRDRE